MKTKTLIGMLFAVSVSTLLAADISVTTSLDRNLPWIDVLKQLDNNTTVAAAFASRLSVTGIVPSANVATWMGTPSSANFAAAITDETGSGKVVFATSPTLVTPTLGVATATSINGNTITTGTGVLTLGAGKTTTFDHTSTFTTTDAQTYTFPTTSATLARTDAANTFTGVQTMTSAALTTPVLTGGFTASGSGANTLAGSTGTFLTSTGANTLSGTTTLAANKNFVYAAGTGTFDGSLGTGIFTTTTGANTLSGDVTLAANKNFTAAAGTGSVDLSAGTGTTKTTTGLTTITGGFVGKTTSLSGPGAVSVVSLVSKLTSTGTGDALTLANGTDGQIKVIVYDVDGGSSILTPTTKTGFSTITFTNVGDTATLVYVTTRGWMIVALFGAVAA